jgi:hypothetical protein
MDIRQLVINITVAVCAVVITTLLAYSGVTSAVFAVVYLALFTVIAAAGNEIFETIYFYYTGKLLDAHSHLSDI